MAESLQRMILCDDCGRTLEDFAWDPSKGGLERLAAFFAGVLCDLREKTAVSRVGRNPSQLDKMDSADAVDKKPRAIGICDSLLCG